MKQQESLGKWDPLPKEKEGHHLDHSLLGMSDPPLPPHTSQEVRLDGGQAEKTLLLGGQWKTSFLSPLGLCLMSGEAPGNCDPLPSWEVGSAKGREAGIKSSQSLLVARIPNAQSAGRSSCFPMKSEQ